MPRSGLIHSLLFLFWDKFIGMGTSVISSVLFNIFIELQARVLLWG